MLGDKISSALSIIGITDTRVSRWLGAPCGCKERQEKLNALTFWAIRVLGGRTFRAREHLNRIIADDLEEQDDVNISR